MILSACNFGVMNCLTVSDKPVTPDICAWVCMCGVCVCVCGGRGRPKLSEGQHVKTRSSLKTKERKCDERKGDRVEMALKIGFFVVAWSSARNRTRGGGGGGKDMYMEECGWCMLLPWAQGQNPLLFSLETMGGLSCKEDLDIMQK